MNSNLSLGNTNSDLDLAGLILELGRYDLLSKFLMSVSENVLILFE